MDDIVLRNILILGEQLKVAYFGQSILLPLDIDMTPANKKGLDVHVEILHFGWILYSIASFHVHKYYFFGSEDHDLCCPGPDSFPHVKDTPFKTIIKKRWRGEYVSMPINCSLPTCHWSCDPGDNYLA